MTRFFVQRVDRNELRSPRCRNGSVTRDVGPSSVVGGVYGEKLAAPQVACSDSAAYAPLRNRYARNGVACRSVEKEMRYIGVVFAGEQTL